MTTRHAVIDSPLGELTVVADGGALTGLYFRSHWFRPRRTRSARGSARNPTTCWPQHRPS